MGFRCMVFLKRFNTNRGLQGLGFRFCALQMKALKIPVGLALHVGKVS